jgi:hypothetical protein
MAFGSFNALEDYEEIKAYFATKDIRAYDLGLNQALEQILGNVHWITVGCALLGGSNLLNGSLQHATDDVVSWLNSWKRRQ